jgi:hypothetical protein
MSLRHMIQDDVALMFSPDEMGDYVEYTSRDGDTQEIAVIIEIAQDGPGTAFGNAGTSSHAYALIQASDVPVPAKGDLMTYVNEHASCSKKLPTSLGASAGSAIQMLVALFGGTTWRVGNLVESDGNVHRVELTARERMDPRRVVG